MKPHNNRMNPTGSAHQALPSVGLRGLSPAGYPRRRSAGASLKAGWSMQ